jgi:two-component system response regulator RpaA
MASEAKKIRVLLVEDEPALRDIYSTKLDIEGFEVIAAADGVEGFDKAVQNLPDIVLLDLILPIKDGFDVLKDLKANPATTHIPVVILSNLGQPYEVKRGIALGAEDFLTKANLTPAKVAEETRRILAKVEERKQK